MTITEGNPPKDTRRVFSWADLPADEALTCYQARDRQGREYEIWAKGKRRRVLEGLIRSPLYAASYARLSDHVDHLRRAGLDIETLMFRDDHETQRRTFGVYVLHSSIVLTNEAEAA